jgi:hypothetical protein
MTPTTPIYVIRARDGERRYCFGGAHFTRI